MTTAIILSGGGCACAFGGGFMTALEQEFHFSPDAIIAGSGSAGTATYFCSHQTAAIERIWTEHLVSKLFVNKTRIRKIMDINYLVDVIFKEIEPLDTEALQASSTKLIIAATRKSDGQAVFFDDWLRFNIFEILRATKSIPFICNRGVMIEQELYWDSLRSSGVGFLGNGARIHEYDRIIVIQNGINTWMQKLLGSEKMPLRTSADKTFFVTNDTKLYLHAVIDNSKQSLAEQFQKGHLACRTLWPTLQ